MFSFEVICEYLILFIFFKVTIFVSDCLVKGEFIIPRTAVEDDLTMVSYL